MLHIILFRPEIPQNTGNIGRLCAFTNSTLHLIHPLGFTITDKHLRRSGMDYWKSLDVRHHEDWNSFLDSKGRPQRIWLLSTHAKTSFWDIEFRDGDGLLFGNEGHGAPAWLHEWIGENRLKIPCYSQGLRSLNLANAVGIVTYEALRQINITKH